MCLGIFTTPGNAVVHVAWYSASIGKKLDRTSDFFVDATGSNGKELTTLLHSIRDRAWALDAYPCFGRWLFLLPGISGLSWYDDVVLKRAREGATVLDLGCGLGQEIRRVAVTESVKSTQLYVLDVSQEIWALGLELFGDASSPPAKFIQADARTDRYAESLRANSEQLFQLSGKVDVVLMGLFLDLFHFPGQVEVGKTVAMLSKVGTHAVGYSRGTTTGNAVEEEVKDAGTRSMVHDDKSLKTLWFDIGELTKTKWKVEVNLVEIGEFGWEQEDVGWMGGPPPMGICFVATRES
ncbi:hypothetical protein K469DRAFT_744980 [Zopfia rhizophila CBS 207.26]|uniref:Methyltransferase domain-containing protein n=1 Tax=Zopfia rhizophila CBS 207.26 TaxID=1314779 RepID=A0A6A6ERJ0_9PEZI|nr:hypothetical protein K469DRAFT_744980 [Zopfia rhizophila CBS 207.26]